MFKKDDLIRTEEYWMENIQNEIYFILNEYMKKNGKNQTELAEELGFSKGYISQVLKGNFNHSLKKLVNLLLAVDVAPNFDFIEMDKYSTNIDRKFEGNVIQLQNIEALSDKANENLSSARDDFKCDLKTFSLTA